MRVTVNETGQKRTLAKVDDFGARRWRRIARRPRIRNAPSLNMDFALFNCGCAAAVDELRGFYLHAVDLAGAWTHH